MTLTLRLKTLITITITLIALVIALYFGISFIVVNSFSDLEEEDVGRHVQRVTEAINNELLDLNSKLNDWAKPGQDLDVARLASLLDDEAGRVSDQRGNKLADLLANLDVNVFLWTDSSDKIFWGWGYDEVKQELALVPKGLRDELRKPNSRLLRHPEGETSVKGIVLLPEEGPMFVVSAPIMYRIGAGPVEEASMIMGKLLDEGEIKRLEDLTRLSLAIPRIDALPPDFEGVRSSLSRDTIAVKALRGEDLPEEHIAGYKLLEDIYGIPALMLRADVPRDIRDEGNKSLNFLLIALVVVGVVLVVVVAFLLDRLVLSRMASLNTQVSGINTSTDLSTRVSIPGKDELSNLGDAINGMLGDIQTERGKSDTLLLNVLPEAISDRLKEGETAIADSFSGVSVMFSDVVGITKLSAQIAPGELVEMLNRLFSAFDHLTDRHGLEKIKTIGDAYMVVGGLPTPREDHADAIAAMALDMQTELARLNEEQGTTLSIRIGINSGPVVAGVIGTRKFIYDLWGDTVNTAARMESHGVEGLTQVTADTYELLKDKFLFEDRGIIDVKGKGDMHVYLLKGSRMAVSQLSAPNVADC